MEPSDLFAGTATREELRPAWSLMWDHIHKTSLELRDRLTIDEDVMRVEWTGYRVCVEVVSAPSGFFLEVRVGELVYLYNPATQRWIEGRRENNTLVPTKVQGEVREYGSSTVLHKAFDKLRSWI
jgi:hypothetical protein